MAKFVVVKTSEHFYIHFRSIFLPIFRLIQKAKPPSFPNLIVSTLLFDVQTEDNSRPVLRPATIFISDMIGH